MTTTDTIAEYPIHHIVVTIIPGRSIDSESLGSFCELCLRTEDNRSRETLLDEERIGCEHRLQLRLFDILEESLVSSQLTIQSDSFVITFYASEE